MRPAVRRALDVRAHTGGRVSLVAGRRLVAESMWVTLSQLLFSVASVVSTAYVTRSASVHEAATVFAVYALESIAITSARGFVITGPLLRHADAVLCPGDIMVAARAFGVLTLASVVPYAALGYWLSHSWATAVAAACWAAGMFFADILRQLIVVFGARRRACLGSGVFLVLVLLLQLAPGLSFRGFLLWMSALAVGFALSLTLTIVPRSQPGCGFWRAERRFSGSQAVEGAVAVAVVSLTMLVLARLAPGDLVGMQVASQALIGPALLLSNGFAIPFTRRASLRQRQGRSDLGVLLAWAAIPVACLGSVEVVAAVGSGVLTHVFGSPWHAARFLVPAIAVQSLVFVGNQIALTRYRRALPPTPLRRYWILLTFVGYGAILLGVVIGGPGSLREAIWIANGLIALLSVAAIARFERGLRAVRVVSTVS